MSSLSQFDGVYCASRGSLRVKSTCFRAVLGFRLLFGLFGLLQMALSSCVFVTNECLEHCIGGF